MDKEAKSKRLEKYKDILNDTLEHFVEVEELNLIADFIKTHLFSKMEGKEGNMLYSIIVEGREAERIETIVKQIDWSKK